MEVSHSKNLKEICRLCGVKNSFLRPFKVERNKAEFAQLFNETNPDINIYPPKNFCHSCKTKYLTPLNKVRVIGGDRREIDALLKEIKVFDFDEHSENCQVCQQFTNPIEQVTGSSSNPTNNNVDESVDQREDNDVGGQHEDVDVNEASIQPSLAFHLQCLKEVCSLCGIRVKIRQHLQPFKFYRPDNEKDFLDLLAQNRNALNPCPQKNKFCRLCSRNELQNLNSARDIRNEYEIALEAVLEKLHIFKQHQQNGKCEICSQYTPEEIQSFNRQSESTDSDDSAVSEDSEESELMGLNSSGDNLDLGNSFYGLSTPNKRDRSQISDLSTDECEETPRSGTPKRLNTGNLAQSSPTVYDKVSSLFIS